jgi:hypothetical protein
MSQPMVAGEVVGTTKEGVFATIVEVHDDYVVLKFADGSTEPLYLWESVRGRVATLKRWSFFEHWCHRLSPLERMVHECA